MARHNWQKSYRELPLRIKATLDQLTDNDIKVIAGKKISVDDVVNGKYAHIGLVEDKLHVGKFWEMIPPTDSGMRSKRNKEGWEVVRKDLPKYTKYFYHDIQNFGDGARNGWSTVAIPREVYERDVTPPYMFHIQVSVQERDDNGNFGIVFSIGEILSKVSTTFEDDLLFAVNLLQENTGVSDVASARNPDFVFTNELNWDVFPPGNIDDIVNLFSKSNNIASIPDPEEVRERLRLFEQFEPVEYLKGLGGNDHYIGAKYADDLVVFENLRHGNALYVLYGNWEQLAQKSRSELLRLGTKEFDRIIHSEGWQNKFAVLMQKELSQRGLRVRIGRNFRRRR